MTKFISILVAIVGVVLVISLFGHFLVLAAVGIGGFVLGNVTGKAQAKLQTRSSRKLNTGIGVDIKSDTF